MSFASTNASPCGLFRSVVPIVFEQWNGSCASNNRKNSLKWSLFSDTNFYPTNSKIKSVFRTLVEILAIYMLVFGIGPLLSIGLFLGIGPLYAQSGDLVSLLESYPEEPALIAVFTSDSRVKIAEISVSQTYQVIQNKGRWSVIQFDQPTVPVWVSEDYLDVENGFATVRAIGLNARLRPELNAPILIEIKQGYKSPMLASENGFAMIKAPAELAIAIQRSSKQRSEEQPASTDKASGTWKTASGGESSENRRASRQGDTSPSMVSVLTKGKRVRKPERTEATESDVKKLKSTRAQQHIIAPGDTLSLTVFGEPDLSVASIRVPQSGRVSLPLIGAVEVGGKTTKQVEESVRKTLAQGYVNNPRLSVTIFSYRPIFIRGAVQGTGSFPYTEGLSVAQALALAGGTKKSAKVHGVSILRAGATIESGLALDSQYSIASGDVITVEEELGVSEDAALFIYLHGEVTSPGEYLFRKGLTVEKAIVLAGGFTLRGSSKKIKVTRYNGIVQNEQPEKLKGVKLYTPVEPGDVINVGARWF